MNINTVITDHEKGLLVLALLGLVERHKGEPVLARQVEELAAKFGCGLALPREGGGT